MMAIVPANTRRNIYDVATPLPSMHDTLLGWFRPLTLVFIQKRAVDFETVETNRREITTSGVLQPYGEQELAMLPEGQRKWIHKKLHAVRDLVLAIDDVVEIAKTSYRVLDKLDFSDYGYVRYHLVEDYEYVSA